MISENLDDNDVGFQILDETDTHDVTAVAGDYLFKRSEIDNAIRSSPPRVLYLRNKSRMEDYFIHFSYEDNKKTFMDLFPDATYNEYKTADYYFMPSGNTDALKILNEKGDIQKSSTDDPIIENEEDDTDTHEN